MIDTMFFLLVFFMLSSLALTKLNGLPVNLPQASTSTRQPSADLTVTIDKASQVFVNKTPVSVTDLGTELVRAAKGGDLAQTLVVLNADESVHHGLFVRCMNQAREVGVTRFAIATAPEAGG